MKILVTGGNGFIGRNVCMELLSKGHQVVCLDKFIPESYDRIMLKNIEYLQRDLFADVSQDTFADLPDGIEGIVHLASSSIPETADQDMYRDVKENLLGTMRLLNYAAENKIKLFIFMSSGGTVYGQQATDVITEDMDRHPICCYGATKAAIENYMRLYRSRYGICTLALRLANPYGRFQRINAKQGVIPIFCRKALHNEEIQIFGDGTIERDYICINDVCSAVCNVIDVYYPDFLSGKALPPEINIGSGVGTSLNEILYIISNTLDKELTVRYINGRKIDVKKNILDISNAEKFLKWSPKTSIQDGIPWMLKYFKSYDE